MKYVALFLLLCFTSRDCFSQTRLRPPVLDSDGGMPIKMAPQRKNSPKVIAPKKPVQNKYNERRAMRDANRASQFNLSNVYYSYGQSALNIESMSELDGLVSFINNNPTIKVEVYSYSDAREGDGGDEDGIYLSEGRARAVMDYLTKNGISREQMSGKAFGKKNPAAPNEVNGRDNPSGRQLNRRTEFRIITDKPTHRILYNSALPGTMEQQQLKLQ